MSAQDTSAVNASDEGGTTNGNDGEGAKTPEGQEPSGSDNPTEGEGDSSEGGDPSPSDSGSSSSSSSDPKDSDASSSSASASQDESKSSSSAASSDKSADKDDKDDKDKEEDEKEREKKEKAERKAREMMDEAEKELAEGQEAANELSGLVSKLDSARAPFDEAVDKSRDATESRRKAEERLGEDAAGLARSRGQAAKARMDAVVSSSDAVRPGGGVASEIVDKHREADDARASYEDMRSDLLVTTLGVGSAQKASRSDLDELRKAAEDGNDAAFDIELACAEARVGYTKAKDAVKDIDTDVEGVKEFLDDLDSAVSRIDDACSAAQDKVGDWYEAQDAAIGADDSLTFGAGVEFLLSEDEFVERWGKAIDDFFSSRGAPLAGQGETMARSAYKWHIDPRLCAAISITESSGGAACVRPHNAWGWGAADADPVGLASEWSSWEEGIEAWHEGMATNGAGLGSASTITSMGKIYASSPYWARNTIRAMRDIA